MNECNSQYLNAEARRDKDWSSCQYIRYFEGDLDKFIVSGGLKSGVHEDNVHKKKISEINKIKNRSNAKVTSC